MNDTTGSKKKRVSGWLSIKGPEDLERAVVRMLNKILASDDPLQHAGRFASLANTWLNAKRLELEAAFLAKLTDEELDRLGDIIQRTDEWQKEPTEEESCFLAELRAKYAVQMG